MSSGATLKSSYLSFPKSSAMCDGKYNYKQCKCTLLQLLRLHFIFVNNSPQPKSLHQLIDKQHHRWPNSCKFYFIPCKNSVLLSFQAYTCIRNRNRNLENSSAPTKAISWEPAYSHGLNKNNKYIYKQNRQASRGRYTGSGRQTNQGVMVFRGWCLELKQ